MWFLNSYTDKKIVKEVVIFIWLFIHIGIVTDWTLYYFF